MILQATSRNMPASYAPVRVGGISSAAPVRLGSVASYAPVRGTAAWSGGQSSLPVLDTPHPGPAAPTES